MMGITAAMIVSLIRDMPDDEAAELIDDYAKTVASCEVVTAVEKAYSRILGVIEAPTVRA